jgi:hypothetical protein
LLIFKKEFRFLSPKALEVATFNCAMASAKRRRFSCVQSGLCEGSVAQIG